MDSGDGAGAFAGAVGGAGAAHAFGDQVRRRDEVFAERASALGMTPLVRVPDKTPSTIQKVLDAGAAGVLVPLGLAFGAAAPAVEAARSGCGFVVVSNDTSLLANAAREVVSQVRAGIA